MAVVAIAHVTCGGLVALPSGRSAIICAMRSASNFTQARTAAKAFQGKPVSNQHTGIIVVMSRKSLDKMLNGKAVSKSGNPVVHATAVANADVLFERAVLGWSKPDRAADPAIKLIHRFFAPMQAGEQRTLVKLTVKETVDAGRNNPLYTIEVLVFGHQQHWIKWMRNAALEDGILWDEKIPQRLELAYPDNACALSPDNFGPRGDATEAAPSFSAGDRGNISISGQPLQSPPQQSGRGVK